MLKATMAAGLVAAVTFAGAATTAHAGQMLKVDRDGETHTVRDRALPSRAQTAMPEHGRTRVITPRPIARAATLPPAEQGEIDAALAEARRTRDALPARAAREELSGAIANVEALQTSGQLTVSRVAATLMTLRRNTEFWRANQPPAPGTRVKFTGSPVILEYYPGEGLQIQPLANFGKANGLYSLCRADANTTCTKLRTLLDAMLALASQRGGFTAWEYFFDFEGGVPPWTSSMSQGTAVQALSRAYRLTGVAKYRDAAAAAVGAFETAPPTGVAVPATGGTHFLVYSYAPQLFIFGGFLQSLIGLDDYRDFTGDVRGTNLFRAGHGNAKAILPLSDTGSWSRYSLDGPESTPEQHILLRDFLDSLCHRQGNAVYCDTAARFTGYLAARGS